jgi:hypothetical protein
LIAGPSDTVGRLASIFLANVIQPPRSTRDFWGDLGVDSIWVDSATLKAFLVSFLAHSGSTGVPAIEPTEVPLRRYSSAARQDHRE